MSGIHTDVYSLRTDEIWDNIRIERCFNVAGPCIPEKHYMLPALDRLPGIRRLVSRGECFVIHAPRQTGKTTALKVFVREINAKGDMTALYCTHETLQGATDPARALSSIASLLKCNARNVIHGMFKDETDSFCACEDRLPFAAGVLAVSGMLRCLCRLAGKPLVVFFDEADCLFGQVLISFLRHRPGKARHAFLRRESDA